MISRRSTAQSAWRRALILIGTLLLATTATWAASATAPAVRPARVHRVPAHLPAGQAGATRQEMLNEIRRLREALEIQRGGGGGQLGPFGRTCEEARAALRWSGLPCAPDMPEK